MLSKLIRIDEAILMSSNNIHIHDKTWKFPKISRNIFYLELLKEFHRDSTTSSKHPRLTSHRCSSH